MIFNIFEEFLNELLKQLAGKDNLTREERDALLSYLSDLKNRYENQILVETSAMLQQGYYWPENDIFKPLLPKFTKLSDELEREVVREIQYFYKNYRTSYDAIEGIKDKFNISKNYARLLFNTGQLALRNKMEMDNYLQEGIVYFQYVGNGAQRKFCKEHLDKVYHIDEIMKLDNKQKLPVIYFCGGYNCMHSWRPIFDWQYAEFGVKIK